MSDTDNMKGYVTNQGEGSVEKQDESGKKISEYSGQSKKNGFFYGDALNDSNINNIVGESQPHVVVLVGFPKYGKSTFVASFYHAVMTTGQIGKYKFVDSDTLVGFERRAYIRNAELKIKTRLDRTLMYDDFFLSFLFDNKETGNKVKLILSDRSGEDYREYGKFEAAIIKDKSLKHARHIIFFLDAEATASDRYLDMQNDLGMLLPRMKKYGAFEGKKCVDVVFNKIDLVTDEMENDYETNRDEIVNKIKVVTSINKVEALQSLHVPMNDDCIKFFEYLLDSCEQPDVLSDEEKEKQDWVNKKLKN